MIPCCLLLVHFTPLLIRIGPFLLIVAVMLTLSHGVQPCTHANSTLFSMRYWFVPLVTGLFLACSACYWPVPWLFRLLLTCSLLVPLVTGLLRVLETSTIGCLMEGGPNKWEGGWESFKETNKQDSVLTKRGGINKQEVAPLLHF